VLKKTLTYFVNDEIYPFEKLWTDFWIVSLIIVFSYELCLKDLKEKKKCTFNYNDKTIRIRADCPAIFLKILLAN